MPNFTKLAAKEDMWTYLGFEPWEQGTMQGVSRKITMVKDSLLGPVAKYYALDYVVWAHQGLRDIDYVMREWLPLPDVVTQRFLFVGGPTGGRRKARSYWLGLKGFLEGYSYTPGENCHARIKDLTPPIDLAWNEDDTDAS